MGQLIDLRVQKLVLGLIGLDVVLKTRNKQNVDPIKVKTTGMCSAASLQTPDQDTKTLFLKISSAAEEHPVSSLHRVIL